MKTRHVIAAVLVLALAFGAVVAAETLKSGPQVGQQVPGPFHPLNINGEAAGQKLCLYCKNGNNPVAMVFARSTSEPLTKLVKKLDACCGKNSDAKMGSFVVFLSDDEALAPKLKDLAATEKLQNVILAIDNPAGPKDYNVAKDADVTVVLYKEHQVKSNRAFKKGELTDKDIEAVIADMAKVCSAN